MTCDITVDPNAKPSAAQGGGASGGQRAYTVQAGDSLSKISKDQYGNANDYMKMFEANRDGLSDPNKIIAGQTLKIPD